MFCYLEPQPVSQLATLPKVLALTDVATRLRQLRLASVCSADVAAKWDERLAANGPMPLEAPDTRCEHCMLVSFFPSVPSRESSCQKFANKINTW